MVAVARPLPPLPWRAGCFLSFLLAAPSTPEGVASCAKRTASAPPEGDTYVLRGSGLD